MAREIRIGTWNCFGMGQGIDAVLHLRAPHGHRFADAEVTFGGERVGWDRLARNGAIHASVDLGGGLALDLVNVHLQAGYDEAASRVRHTQLAHLHALVERSARRSARSSCAATSTSPASRRRGREPSTARCAMRSTASPISARTAISRPSTRIRTNALACAFEPKSPAQRVDYVLLRDAGRARCTSVSRFFDRPTESGWPSDHYGVEVTLRIA